MFIVFLPPFLIWEFNPGHSSATLCHPDPVWGEYWQEANEERWGWGSGVHEHPDGGLPSEVLHQRSNSILR